MLSSRCQLALIVDVPLQYTVNDDDWYESGGITDLPVMENEYR
jgi:hypothetical protein